MKNQVMLITYPDSLGGNLQSLDEILRAHFAGLFPGGIHILPPFPSSGDRGFAPVTYDEIEPAFGMWADIERLATHSDIMVDLMVNHISRRSPYFRDFLKRGRKSPHVDLFLTLDKIWPGEQPRAEDIAKIFLRKPEHPFSTVTIEETGEQETLWTTFGTRDWSEQIDLDVRSPAARELLTHYLALFARHKIKLVRLDAVGYVIKKPGTSCFMVEPEIYDFLDWISGVAASLGLALLPEVHGHYSIQSKLAARGFWVYDFVLPFLILYTLLNRSSSKLRAYLEMCPRRQVTMLDCHDGIPVLPDLEGILSIEELRGVVNTCLARGANLSRLLSAHKGPDDFDAHQINCTYYSALGSNDGAYLAARAIQFFAPGVPQVYYVGLLAGQNDQDAVQVSGERRALNRHNYSRAEVEQSLMQPVVQRLLRLIRFRNAHPAFHGDLRVLASADDELKLLWQKGDARCELEVELQTYRAQIRHTTTDEEMLDYPV